MVRMPALKMFDTWLSKGTKHHPSNTRKKNFSFWSNVFIKHHQRRSNMTKQYQTRCLNGKMFFSKQCLMVLVAKHFPFVQGLKHFSQDFLVNGCSHIWVGMLSHAVNLNNNQDCCWLIWCQENRGSHRRSSVLTVTCRQGLPLFASSHCSNFDGFYEKLARLECSCWLITL